MHVAQLGEKLNFLKITRRQLLRLDELLLSVSESLPSLLLLAAPDPEVSLLPAAGAPLSSRAVCPLLDDDELPIKAGTRCRNVDIQQISIQREAVL